MRPIGAGPASRDFEVAFGMSRFKAIGMALMLTACSHSDLSMERPFPSGAKYVALGSSFAAGAGIGAAQADSPDRCGRTVNNYPSLLAERFGLVLDYQSCGGATTQHVVTPWNELPAQIDAVDRSTSLVTITIGGNDVNYVGNLLMASCTVGETVEIGDYQISCTAPQRPSEKSFREIEAGLTEIVRQIRLKAPMAHNVFVQYASLVPVEPCPFASMSVEEAQRNRKIGLRLAEITSRVAKASRSLLLEADLLSRERTPCDAEPWAIGMSGEMGLAKGTPWHPNAQSHQAIANALIELFEPKSRLLDRESQNASKQHGRQVDN